MSEPEVEVLPPEVDIINDRCPVCKTFTSEFKSIGIIPQLGWMECDICGAVFCPESVRMMKRMQRQSPIIVPPAGMKV